MGEALFEWRNKAPHLQCWHARCTLDPGWTTVKAAGRPGDTFWLSSMSSMLSSSLLVKESREGAWGGRRGAEEERMTQLL